MVTKEGQKPIERKNTDLHNQQFEAIYTEVRPYEENAKRYINRIVKDPGASEEIMQDIYFKLWLHAENLSTSNYGVEGRRGFVFDVARNMSINYINARTKRQTRENIFVRNSNTIVQNPEQIVLEHEIFNKNLRTLPKKRREVVTKILDGYEHKEVAEKLDITENAVRMHMHKAGIDIDLMFTV